MVAEGVKTARTVIELGREHGVALPIADEVDAVVNDGRSAEQAYRGLAPRDTRIRTPRGR